MMTASAIALAGGEHPRRALSTEDPDVREGHDVLDAPYRPAAVHASSHAAHVASKDVAPAMTKGQYNNNALVQTKVLQPALELLVQAVADIPIAPGKAVQVLELGCSQGINSMQPVKAILEVLTGRAKALNLSAKLEVSVVHDDLPNNDFEPLMQLIENKETTYMPQDPSSPLVVLPSFIGRSCYQRLVPSASVQLVFSFTTLHWISGKPQTDCGLFNFLSTDEKVQAAYREQALSDLISVLRLRAEETVPGGIFQAHFSAFEGGLAGRWAMGALHRLTGDWVACGKLTRQEVTAMSPPFRLRSKEEVQQALESVEDVWSVKSFFARQQAGINYSKLMQGIFTPAQYAALVRRQVAAVMQGYMQGQLARSRGEEVAREVVTGLFDAYERVLEQTPEDDDVMVVYFVLQRTGSEVAV